MITLVNLAEQATAAGDSGDSWPPYSQRSLLAANLILHSSLHTPKRKPRKPACINLVSASNEASTTMSGPEVDPKILSAANKLDFLITQVMSLIDLGTCLSGQMETTGRMNRHDTRLVSLEKKP
jgi:hypothetical protein